jgi:adenylyl cyclase-associated protein
MWCLSYTKSTAANSI